MLNSYEALNFLRNGTMNLWNFYVTNYFIRFVRKAKVKKSVKNVTLLLVVIKADKIVESLFIIRNGSFRA